MRKRRSRRLRKKLQVGEFREFGCELALQFNADLAEAASDAFWQSFIVDCVEHRGLAFGGAETGYLTRTGRGSVSAEDRQAVHAWLAARSELAAFKLGPLQDVWNPARSLEPETTQS